MVRGLNVPRPNCATRVASRDRKIHDFSCSCDVIATVRGSFRFAQEDKFIIINFRSTKSFFHFFCLFKQTKLMSYSTDLGSEGLSYKVS